MEKLDITKLIDDNNNIDPIVLKDLFIKINDTLLSGENPLMDFTGNIYDAIVYSGDNLLSHSLGFKPNGVILVYMEPDTLDISVDLTSATTTQISITSSGDGKIRMILGSFGGDNVS